MPVLWRMRRGTRLRLWRLLGMTFCPSLLQELELGGEFGCMCPVDSQEMQVLLGEGGGDRDQQQKLRVLLLMYTTLDDEGLCMLADRGCGRALQALSLVGALLYCAVCVCVPGRKGGQTALC